MKTLPPRSEMLDAVARGDGGYEGVFVFAVRTTGVFCRPACRARKPRAENVEFFADAAEAERAGYRACRKCLPLEAEGAPPAWLEGLLAALDAEPARRWTDADLRGAGLEPARVRRWFRRHRGATFHGFQRARRLGIALGELGGGATGAGVGVGFESESGFRTAFARWFGEPPGAARGRTRVLVTRFETGLGPMLAGATDTGLCLLEFADRRALATQIRRLRGLLDAHFAPGENDVLAQARGELGDYFVGRRRAFTVPLELPGTAFQQAVWSALRAIPHGETRSYGELAAAIGRPGAVRAVGRANGDNRLAVVVPCHRVVGADGRLVGYGGLLWRKRALLELERG